MIRSKKNIRAKILSNELEQRRVCKHGCGKLINIEVIAFDRNCEKV